MAALVKPFGMCAEVLNPAVASEIFSPGLEKAVNYIRGLEENDFKEKVSAVSLLVWPWSVAVNIVIDILSPVRTLQLEPNAVLSAPCQDCFQLS